VEFAWKCVNLWNDLSFNLYTMLFNCYIIVTSDERKESEIKVSTDWYVTIEY